MTEIYKLIENEQTEFEHDDILRIIHYFLKTVNNNILFLKKNNIRDFKFKDFGMQIKKYIKVDNNKIFLTDIHFSLDKYVFFADNEFYFEPINITHFEYIDVNCYPDERIFKKMCYDLLFLIKQDILFFDEFSEPELCCPINKSDFIQDCFQNNEPRACCSMDPCNINSGFKHRSPNYRSRSSNFRSSVSNEEFRSSPQTNKFDFNPFNSAIKTEQSNSSGSITNNPIIPNSTSYKSLFDDNIIIPSKMDQSIDSKGLTSTKQPTESKKIKHTIVEPIKYNSDIINSLEENALTARAEEEEKRVNGHVEAYYIMKKDIEINQLSEDGIADFFIDKYTILKFMDKLDLIDSKYRSVIFVELYDILVNKEIILDAFEYLDSDDQQSCAEYIKNNMELF